MPDEGGQSNAPAIWRDDFSVTRASSRLVKRGLLEIERKSHVLVNVVDVHVCQDFIILLSDDWDVQGERSWDYSDRSYHDLSAVWQRRSLILYRFDPRGVFLERLTLRLAELRSGVRSHIKQRLYQTLEIRDEFIWFRETFATDFSYFLATVNYVFSSSSGELLVSWDNVGDLVDSRLPRHLVFSDPGFQPSWFLSDIMFSFKSLSDEGDEHLIYHVNVQDLIKAAVVADHDGQFTEEGELIHRSHFKAPVNNFLFGSSMAGPDSIAPWELVSTGDASSAWFMCSRNQDPDDGDLLWRLHFHGDHPVVTVMNMPDEATLLGNGILELPSDWPNEAVFQSDSEDWARILEKSWKSWDEAHGDDEPEWYISVDRNFFRSPRFFASESTVVLVFLLDLSITSDVVSGSMYGRAVAFSVREDRLIPIKSFDTPYSMGWEIKGLRESHLFGLADTDTGPPEVFIYDLASERITTFQPYVEKFS